MKLLVISFALVAFFVYWSTKIFYHPDTFYEYDIQGRRNTFCSDGETKVKHFPMIITIHKSMSEPCDMIISFSSFFRSCFVLYPGNHRLSSTLLSARMSSRNPISFTGIATG
jgi:hypothetical protein